MASTPIIPCELIVEILSWLPVKTLMRFRCVSKTWKSLIFNSYFVKLHLERTSRNMQVLLKLKDEDDDEPCTLASFCSTSSLIQNPASSFDDSHQHPFAPLKSILGSCNGLFCLHDSLFVDECEEHWVRFWNPATKIMSEPSPRLCIRSPKKPYYTKRGYCYDDWSDTFKVVAMILEKKTQQMNVWVYCMGDTCWKNILTCPSFSTFEQVGCSLDGTVNWIGFSREFYKRVTFADIEILEILSYDVRTDSCRYLTVPDCNFQFFSEPYLAVLNDCLCVSIDDERINFVVLLLIEVRDERSWTKLLNIPYESLQINTFLLGELRILCLSGDVLLLANYEENGFILFNMKDNKVERTESFIDFEFHMVSFNYVPSLLLPH